MLSLRILKREMFPLSLMPFLTIPSTTNQTYKLRAIMIYSSTVLKHISKLIIVEYITRWTHQWSNTLRADLTWRISNSWVTIISTAWSQKEQLSKPMKFNLSTTFPAGKQKAYRRKSRLIVWTRSFSNRRWTILFIRVLSATFKSRAHIRIALRCLNRKQMHLSNCLNRCNKVWL